MLIHHDSAIDTNIHICEQAERLETRRCERLDKLDFSPPCDALQCVGVYNAQLLSLSCITNQRTRVPRKPWQGSDR